MHLSLARVLFVSAGILTGLDSAAFAADIWTNSNGGLWREPVHWSAGRAPFLGLGSTFITNANSKAVIVDAATPPTNLVINALTLSGPANTTNTLQLLDLGLSNPLIVSNNSFNIYRGGALSVTNSSLMVTGRFISFNVWMGSVTLDSGSIHVREEPPTSNVTVFTRIGRTNAASLIINGGTMQASSLLVGESPDIQFGRSHGTVKINGGQLSVAGEFSIGESLMCTGVVEVAGGQLLVANNETNITRVGNSGVGRLIVSNSIALLNNVSVGRHDGASGNLTILSNGFVGCSDDLSIGRFSGAAGEVVVAGGQLVVTNHPIWIGREGVGRLTAFDGLVQAEELLLAVVPTNTAQGDLFLYGGTVLIHSNAIIGEASLSTGRVFMAAGNLMIANNSNSASLIVTRGDLTINGGTMTVDRILLTNLTGNCLFHGGTLRTKSTQVSNGLPFVVGDGTNAATLDLLGGTHSFANGLVISSNATLTGCGTIIGPIANFGTIATNCGGGTPQPPSITQQPVSLTVTQGGNANFTVVAAGDPPLSYHWRFNGNDIGGATSASLEINNAQATDAGNYDVVVLNNSGSVTSVPATLTVRIPPSITVPPASLTVTQGNDATFTVAAVGDPPLSYQWRFNGNDIGGATSASLAINNAQANDAGNYDVVVLNNSGSVTSAVARLTVGIPPSITVPPVSLTVTQGDTATFTVAAAGDPPLSYQWRFEGNDIGGATSASFAISNAQAANAGNYDVVVRNNSGSVTSAVARLTVLTPPLITQQPQDQTVPENTDATFSVTASGSPPLFYQWQSNGVDVINATNVSLMVSNALLSQGGEIYRVIVTNAAGSVTSDPATLFVTALPTWTITTQPQSRTVVAGTNVSFSVSANGTPPLTYQWRFEGTDILEATNATLMLTNVQPANAGTYGAVVYDAGGDSRTSLLATLTVLVPPTIAQPPQSLSVVAGSNVTFTVVAGGTPPLSYEWRFNGLPLADQTNDTLTLSNVQTGSAGPYTVVVSNSAGSVTTDPAILRVLIECELTQVSRSESGSTLSFTTVSGLTYTVEYKDSLTDANWIALLSAATGTGAEMTVQDAQAGAPTRFYRVRIE